MFLCISVLWKLPSDLFPDSHVFNATICLLPHLARHPSSRAQAASHGNNKARIFISRVFMLLGHDTEAAGYKVHLAFQNFRYAHHEMGYVESIAT